MRWLEYLLGGAAGVAVGLFLGIMVMRRIWRSRKFRIGATVAAALFSFTTYRDPAERAAFEDTEAETKRKKEKEDGEPPAQVVPNKTLRAE